MEAHKLVALATRILSDSPPAAVSSKTPSSRTTTPAGSPWITVHEAARRARCGIKLIYREFRAGRLKAVRVGGRRELRLRYGRTMHEFFQDLLAHGYVTARRCGHNRRSTGRLGNRIIGTGDRPRSRAPWSG